MKGSTPVWSPASDPPASYCLSPGTSSLGERLAAEFNHAFARTRIAGKGALDGWMRARGVPDGTIDITAMAYASAAVTTFLGAGDPLFDEKPVGWYEPSADGGTRVVLVPDDALGADYPDEARLYGSARGYRSLPDIVAFDLKSPGRWWRRIGHLDVLGGRALSDARAGAPLKLYRDPLAWLIAGRAGAVLIDRGDPRLPLRGIAEIHCQDDAHARWLDARLRAFALRGLPKVTGSSRPQVSGFSALEDHIEDRHPDDYDAIYLHTECT